jgi:hypothetical protein
MTPISFPLHFGTADSYLPVDRLYAEERVSLDLSLDSQRRAVEAKRAFNKALADFERAKSRLDYRKGALWRSTGSKSLTTKVASRFDPALFLGQ